MTVVQDRRALILSQLAVLLSGNSIQLTGTDGTPAVIPAGNFVRNRNELPGQNPADPQGSVSKVPGIILLDGDEVNDPRAIPRAQGQTALQMRAQLVRMTPEIYVVLDVRKPANLNVGEDLNLARMAILGLIIPDPVIQEIVGANGGITYDGCVTDLSKNRDMRGQLGISLTFTYPWLPGEVVGHS